MVGIVVGVSALELEPPTSLASLSIRHAPCSTCARPKIEIVTVTRIGIPKVSGNGIKKLNVTSKMEFLRHLS